MSKRLARQYPGPWGMHFVSFVCHLAVFLIIAHWYSSPEFRPDETPVTYVDMVTLPVESPQAGMPAPAAEEEMTSAAPPPAPAPPEPAPAMTQPAKPAAKAPAANGTVQQSAAEAQAFTERMAKLARVAEEKRQAEVLERLRKKGSSTQTGMPGAKGTEAGSDYTSYIHSRMKDALREVIVTQTKSPQVFATITVAPDGRIAEYHVEKASGDPLFDDAVRRAVTLAGKSLAPPPGGRQFKGRFGFRPEGVAIR